MQCKIGKAAQTVVKLCWRSHPLCLIQLVGELDNGHRQRVVHQAFKLRITKFVPEHILSEILDQNGFGAAADKQDLAVIDSFDDERAAQA